MVITVVRRRQNITDQLHFVKTKMTESQELRIVLIGRVGGGKTAVMKTILNGSEGNEKPSDSKTPILSECEKEKVQIGRQSIVIVDTPGLCQAEKTDEEVLDKIKEGVSLVAPGPHVFLFVMDLDRFTQEEKLMVELVWKTFGKDAAQYTIVLFTHGNELRRNGKTIEDFIKDSKELEEFVSECKGGYHVIDNKTQDPAQVDELLQKIRDVVDKNGGKHYSPKRTELKKKIALSVNGSALAGAGVGAATTYFVGGAVGIKVGAAAGAAVGGVIGCIGIVAFQRIRAKKCVIQ